MKPTSIPISTSTPTPYPYLTPAATPGIEVTRGSLRNQVRSLENDMPRGDSDGYVVPADEEQMAFEESIIALGDSDLERANQLLAQYNYTLSHYIDRGDDHAASYLLVEKKPLQKGWGLYAFRMDSASKIIIEAPHPLSDINTPSVALNIYRALDARALLIAGAHRNANSGGLADVAHTPESIFQSVHKALLQELQTEPGNAIVIQIHGFNSSEHAGYPQVIIGFGEKTHPKELILAKKMETAFIEQGISIGICTGDVWQDLCGTKNIQAGVKKEALFLHVELDEKTRKNDDDLIAALVQVLGD